MFPRVTPLPQRIMPQDKSLPLAAPRFGTSDKATQLLSRFLISSSAPIGPNHLQALTRWLPQSGLRPIDVLASTFNPAVTHPGRQLSEPQWALFNCLIDTLENEPSPNLSQYKALLNLVVDLDIPPELRQQLLEEGTRPALNTTQRFARIEGHLNQWVSKQITPFQTRCSAFAPITLSIPQSWEKYVLAFPPLATHNGPPQNVSDTTAKRFNMVMRLFHHTGISSAGASHMIQHRRFSMFLTAPVPQTEWVPAVSGIVKGPATATEIASRMEQWVNNRLWEESLKPEPSQALIGWLQYFEFGRYNVHKFGTSQDSNNPAHSLWYRLASASGEVGQKAFEKMISLIETQQIDIPSHFFKNLTEKQQERAFFKAMPQALFSTRPDESSDIRHHLYHIEETQYNQEHGDWHHPNEAEMLLLLRHPQDPQRKHVDRVVKALTAIYDHMKNNVEDLSDNMTKLWSDIGFYTHGFLFWKYDARGGPDSLLAQFGASPLKEKYTGKWGKGFVAARYTNPLLPLSPQTSMVFYQPFLAVAHPDFGTLIIRNSSEAPNAGRDKLRHAAYWSDTTLSLPEIANLDPDTDGRFKSVLDHRLYTPTPQAKRPEELSEAERDAQLRPSSPDPMEHYLGFLLGQVDAFKSAYQQWKFSPERKMKSNGFIPLLKTWLGAKTPETHLLELLNNPVETGEKRSLAFVNPHYSPWATLPYTSQGQQQYRYELTPAHREELLALFGNHWPKTRDGLQKIDFYNFLQSGIATGGELMILADNKHQGETSHATS